MAAYPTNLLLKCGDLPTTLYRVSEKLAEMVHFCLVIALDIIMMPWFVISRFEILNWFILRYMSLQYNQGFSSSTFKFYFELVQKLLLD